MNCKVCGRNIEREEANFCEYCGASLRDTVEAAEVQSNAAEQIVSVDKTGEKVITFQNWLGVMMLPLIPFVGSLIYIVMMFIWAFGGNVPKSKKNWARANLIVTAIGFLLLVYLIATMIPGGLSAYSSLLG